MDAGNILLSCGNISSYIYFLAFNIWSYRFYNNSPGRNFLEKKFRFRLNGKLRAVIVILLFAVAISLVNHYGTIDDQKVVTQKSSEEEKITNDKREQKHKDSLEFYLKRFDASLQKHKINDAEQQLKLASSFANTEEEHKQIKAKQIEAEIASIKDLMKARKYAAALPIINNILTNDPENSMLLLHRAICYIKTGNTQKAIEDLKPLLASGNTDAEKLNDKINPIRKKIIGYETLCNDGTMSNARGRGACSHHGGVQDWNHPIYEESRKYE